MNILAFDTSGKACTVSVSNNDKIFTTTTINDKTHSSNLMTMIDYCLKKQNLKIKCIDLIAVVGGPGSFTGVRIGVATAKGLAHGLNIPCVVLNTLDLLSMVDLKQYKYENVLICPIIDARANQVYTACYKNNDNMSKYIDYSALNIIDLINLIKKENMHCIFTGDGVLTLGDYIKNNFSENSSIIYGNSLYPQGKNLISLSKMLFNNAIHYNSIEPIYLRVPQAERNLKSKC